MPSPSSILHSLSLSLSLSLSIFHAAALQCSLQLHSAMSSLLLYFFYLYTSSIAAANSLQNPDNCTSRCGSFEIPFPFYLNATNSSSSCGRTLSNAFCLSCINSSTLFLNLDSQTYRVLQFFPDGVLVDFPNTSTCRQYNDLKSFPFSGDGYFAISADNVLDLYDCEDSSLCKTDCERNLIPGCDGRATGGHYPSCCYPLSDHTSWRPNDSLSNFSQYGCRGFSSWVVLQGSRIGKRGVKLEWAVPGNSTTGPTCAANANELNATSVTSGIRCQCRDGFVGDGFLAGVGCLKSCFKDGKEVHGNDCYRKKHGRKKAIILAVVITSVIAAVSLFALCLVKRTITSDKFVPDKADCRGAILSQKAPRSGLFTYNELEEATKGFGDAQKVLDSPTASLYDGILASGSRVAVQRVQYCENERDLIRIMFRLEALSAVSHRNMAHIIGWSVNSGYSPLVVYEYPENGTFKEHLSRAGDDENSPPLDWHRRLNIAAQTASMLLFLHHETLPPIFHHNLQSGCIFLDTDFSVKLAGFDLQSDEFGCRGNDVYSFGLVLLEMITGNTMQVNNSTTSILQKIKKGKLEEMVAPSLYYHEQPPFRREQIEIIADLATRCLLFGVDGKLSMVDVSRELVHITKENGVERGSSRRGGGAADLEETFSNSSLLQMISMSPDSIHVPSHRDRT